MRSEDDRRAPGATRIQFEGLVEVGGAVGPAFEAQAIDLSPGGMQLRTAYLPELGQRLSCRFDAGPGAAVLASGAVVWRRLEGRGGEFGVHFENLDDESVEALRQMMGAGAHAEGAARSSHGRAADARNSDAGGSDPGEREIDSSDGRSPDAVGRGPAQPKPQAALAVAGTKVRLHIDGLGSPMRARVKDARTRAVTVGSELGFLQVGKELDLEDAGTGAKRAARIDRVEVELDEGSKVPNLVVTLRYADAEESQPLPRKTPGPVAVGGALDDADLDAIRRASGGIKGAMARSAERLGPAMSSFAKRAKVTFTLLADRARSLRIKDDPIAPLRRTTAPAPGGGLHTSGRKVVRGDSLSGEEDVLRVPKYRIDKKKLAAGGVVGVGLILAAVAMRKPAPVAVAPAPEASAIAAAAPVPTEPNTAPITMPPATITPTTSPSTIEPPARRMAARPPQPFSNGPVPHGSVLRLKMDGAIEKIQGASQPTGFTVALPNRRSLDAAAPLAARDGRIASMHVTNDPEGAELSVTFKDGVPNYLVRAKGDVLEVVLASMGGPATERQAAGPAKHAGRAGHASHPGHGTQADAHHGDKHRPGQAKNH